MVSLIYLVLASLLSAEATYFNCSKEDYKTPEACIATRWCVWSTATGGEGGCIEDVCLKYVASVDDADATACQANKQCNLYYITDIHDCTTGEEINQTDLFCRSNNVLLQKQPLDACFYQDLKNRFTASNATKCANLEGGIACAAVTGAGGTYCDSTGNQTCNLYLEDNDLGGFCTCLGVSRCNLYPGCAISKASGGPCVPDPCGYATIEGGACVGNIKDVQKCVVVNVQRVLNNALTNLGYCVSGDSSDVVKKNEYNPCFYGISQTVTYPDWNTNKTSDCQTVDEQNKCADIQTVTCQSVDIAAGWFSSAQGHYCTDNKDRNVPSPSAAWVVHIPAILFLLLISMIF